VNGWTWLGLIVGSTVFLALCALAAGAALLIWVFRAIAAAVAAERPQVDVPAPKRGRRSASPPPSERCWVSPDEQLEFEEITQSLRADLAARHQARYGDDGPEFRMGEVPPC
jgi:hypothetical protein